MTPALRARVMHEWQPFAKPPAPPVIPALAKLVPGVMQRLGLEQRLHESQVQECWAEIVGTQVARHAQPVSLKNGVLKVAIDQPIWHQELFSQKALILKKVRNRLGDRSVREIHFRIG